MILSGPGGGLGARGALGGLESLGKTVVKTIIFYSKFARDPLFCRGETRASVTKAYKDNAFRASVVMHDSYTVRWFSKLIKYVKTI